MSSGLSGEGGRVSQGSLALRPRRPETTAEGRGSSATARNEMSDHATFEFLLTRDLVAVVAPCLAQAHEDGEDGEPGGRGQQHPGKGLISREK